MKSEDQLVKSKNKTITYLFVQDCSDVKDKDEIENKRRHFLLSLFETLVASEGVLGACTIAARSVLFR